MVKCIRQATRTGLGARLIGLSLLITSDSHVTVCHRLGRGSVDIRNYDPCHMMTHSFHETVTRYIVLECNPS